MDYLKLIETVILNLELNGQKNKSEILVDILNNSFTSTELLLSSVSKMKFFMKSCKEVKLIIQDDVFKLEEYCNSIGIYPT